MGVEDREESFEYLHYSGSGFIIISTLTQIHKMVPNGLDTEGGNHTVRNTSRDITRMEFLASQPRSPRLLGREIRGLLMRFAPTPFSEQICQ